MQTLNIDLARIMQPLRRNHASKRGKHAIAHEQASKITFTQERWERSREAVSDHSLESMQPSSKIMQPLSRVKATTHEETGDHTRRIRQ